MSALDALLARLPRTSLIVGKGGVGKTTCAAGIAARFAERGERTLLVSTDPATALATVLDSLVTTEARPVASLANLDARQLSATDLRREFLDRWRDTIAAIVDRGTYLDRADVDGLVDAALPGVDEVFAMLALADLLTDAAVPYARIVVDTAPTGHTLRLLELPETFRALLSMLDLMQEKHRFMVKALTHRYRRDRADDFLDQMRARVDALRATLADERALTAVVITRAEAVVAAETRRYLERLRELHVAVAAIVVNAVGPEAADAPDLLLVDETTPHYLIRRTDHPPRNLPATVEALRSIAEVPTAASRSRPAKKSRSTPSSASASSVVESLPLRTLTIVGGKGGVGKSTVACALAIASADRADGATLLVSTDPAPSIADAFGATDAPWARADLETGLPDVPGLFVRQMDATAAFARVRDAYQGRIDALFDALVGRGLDVARDRAIMRDLLALAPPGIDELFALSVIGDALGEQRFAHIVIDPAPTGHLLRLLEMPGIALDWSHRLLRLMLKYREAVGLGEAAQEILDFARRTKALNALLHDHDRCGLVIVSLDEPVVRAETARLVAAVRTHGVDVSALVWNRVTIDPQPLPETRVTHQYFAQEVAPPPIGVVALRRWLRSWKIP